jgi:multiple sugar transport system ATP-binding protein
MASVRFENVMKRYGDTAPVVKDLSLRIEDKEFLVLVGPSGCGKSTALRMIAGLEDVTGGKLHIGDRVVNDVHPKNRDIAMVFQNYALYPHMSCYDNMAFALRMRSLPKDEIHKRVMAAAKSLDIEPLLERKPKALSGGQRQRIAIGRAVVREPQVFLMDEPLSNLDAKLRVTMRAEIKKLHRRLRTTFVYVTHDQTEAMTLGERIAVMKAGDLQQCDTPHELYRRPVNLFVATFIGSPQMNLLSGKMKLDGDKAIVEGSTGSGTFKFILDKRPSFAEGNVILGVRPEHLNLAPTTPAANGAHGDHKLTATVEVVEPMGFESYVYLAVKTTPATVTIAESFVCRLLEEHTPEPGAMLSITAEADKIHVFDPKTELRLA